MWSPRASKVESVSAWKRIGRTVLDVVQGMRMASVRSMGGPVDVHKSGTITGEARHEEFGFSKITMREAGIVQLAPSVVALNSAVRVL
ncbi:hypothetical protein GFS60_06938 (plasmid) [Rhodococcus sp. WAY2]|nr:hypothetical protein GFS60_06938 [Rhodococcus sp. WAY2]